MSGVNPYQAPQTITSAAPALGPEFEIGPEFLIVSKGARYCYTAVVTVLLTVVAFVVLGMILGLAGGLIALAMPVIFMICAVVHLIGMLLMSKIDPASRASGLLVSSAVLFGAGFFVSVVLVVLQLSQNLSEVPPWLNLLTTVIGCASNILLLIALKRIGEYVQYSQITSKANGALWGLILAYGVWIFYLTLVILAALGHAPFMAKRDMLATLTLVMGISILILSIYALVSYSSALALIGKLQNIKLAVKNFAAPLQIPSNLNIPVQPGQEMDFLK